MKNTFLPSNTMDCNITPPLYIQVLVIRVLLHLFTLVIFTQFSSPMSFSSYGQTPTWFFFLFFFSFFFIFFFLFFFLSTYGFFLVISAKRSQVKFITNRLPSKQDTTNNAPICNCPQRKLQHPWRFTHEKVPVLARITQQVPCQPGQRKQRRQSLVVKVATERKYSKSCYFHHLGHSYLQKVYLAAFLSIFYITSSIVVKVHQLPPCSEKSDFTHETTYIDLYSYLTSLTILTQATTYIWIIESIDLLS